MRGEYNVAYRFMGFEDWCKDDFGLLVIRSWHSDGVLEPQF